MKNLKKLLALVLVAVMVLGVGTIGASAAFTDTTTSPYQEAVDVLSGIGIINGTTATTFNPTGSLTRAGAAKIITYMLLGSTSAAMISNAVTQTFKDVPTSHWASGYIGYCASQGIIAGTGDGTFNPEGTLTTVGFTKMLLVALGYNAEAQGYVGSNWAVNIASDALAAGVSDYRIAISATANCTREQAAQLAFKALTANTVRYTGQSSMTVNGVTITSGGTLGTVPGATGGTSNYDGAAGDGIAQFCETHFSTLKLITTAFDANGLAGHKWQKSGKDISGVYNYAVLLASSSKGTAWATLNNVSSSSYIGFKPDASPSVSFYKNGAASNVGDITTSAALVGSVISFYDTDGDSLYDAVCATEKSVVKLAAAPTTATNAAGDATVTISSLAKYNVLATTLSGYQGLAKDDYVLYWTSAADGVTYIEKAASVTGIVTGFNSTFGVKVDGVYHDDSDLTGGTTMVGYTADDYVNSYTFYLDNSGAVVAAVPGTTIAASNLAVISSIVFVPGNGLTTFDGAQAKIIKTDGTTEVVNVASVNGAAIYVVGSTITGYDNTSGAGGAAVSTAAPGFVTGYLSAGDSTTAVTFLVLATTATPNAAITGLTGSFGFFSINAYGQYVFTNTTPTGYAFAALDNDPITKGTPLFDTAHVGNDSTVFIYETIVAGVPTYTVYTGIANVPTTTGAPTNHSVVRTIVTYGGVAKFVFAKVTATTSATSELIYFPFPGFSTTYESGVVYYEKFAIVNGVANPTVRVADGDKAVTGMYTSAFKSAAGVCTLVDVSANVETGVSANSGSVLMADGTPYLYNSSTKAYYISTLGVVQEMTADAIALSAIDTVYVKSVLGTATVIYVMQKTAAPASVTLAAGDAIVIGDADLLAGTGTATGYVLTTADGVTVTAAAPANCTLSSMTINGAAYTNGAAYVVTVGTYTVQVIYTDDFSGAVYTNTYTFTVAL